MLLLQIKIFYVYIIFLWTDYFKKYIFRWDFIVLHILWQRLQDASKDLPAKLPEKLCAPRAKAALNTKVWKPNVDLI